MKKVTTVPTCRLGATVFNRSTCGKSTIIKCAFHAFCFFFLSGIFLVSCVTKKIFQSAILSKLYWPREFWSEKTSSVNFEKLVSLNILLRKNKAFAKENKKY